MGYYLYGHDGSGNHSSEDRIRGTCALLPEAPTLYSARLEEDWHYGLGKIAGLQRRSVQPRQPIEKDSWCLGCCPDPALCRRGSRAILWGWAPEPMALNRRTLRQLSRYDAVVVPDRLSLERLRKAGLDAPLCLGPDPAFLVEPFFRSLPSEFLPGHTVGLCVSPRSCRYEERDGLLFQGYCVLVRWILENTRLHIALIPYCVRPRWNDCLLLEALRSQFPDSHRICTIADGDSRSLRGDLTRCRVVVGAAGAAAAWSCGIPALHMGLSARAVGLAAELFGSWREAVVPVGELTDEQALLNRFIQFLIIEDDLRRRLERTVPHLRQRARAWDWSVLN